MLRFRVQLRRCAALALVVPVSLAGYALLRCAAVAAEDESAEQPPPRTGEAAIMEALDEKTDLEYEDAALSEVIDEISAKHRVAMRLDRRALDEAGITPATTVSVRARHIRFRSALRMRLREHELTWVIKSGVLVITTKEKADGSLMARMFPVDDLTNPTRSRWTDKDSLVDVITSTIDPGSWGEGNNNGITFLPGVMASNQTREVHDKIQRLLDDIRRAWKLEPVGRGRADNATEVERALESTIAMRFAGVPLRDVAESLADKFQINIFLHKRALAEAGRSPDEPLTSDLPRLKLRDALDLVLTEMDLDWAVADDSLWITTREAAEGLLETKVYDVYDLRESKRIVDEEQLENTLTDGESEFRRTWDTCSGPGTIERLPGMLIVAQTHRVHEWIERILADLRALPAPEPAPPKPDNVVRKVYRVDGVAPERMAEIVAKLIEPESWAAAGGEGTIEAVAATRPGMEQSPVKPAEPPPASEPAASPKTSKLKTKGVLAQFGGGMGMGRSGSAPIDPELARRLPDGWLIVRNRESIHRQIQSLLNDFRGATQHGVGSGGYYGGGGGFF